MTDHSALSLRIHTKHRVHGRVGLVPLTVVSTRSANGSTIGRLSDGREVSIDELQKHGRSVVLGARRFGLDPVHERDAVYLDPDAPAAPHVPPPSAGDVITLTLDAAPDLHVAGIACADCGAATSLHMRARPVLDDAGHPVAPFRMADGEHDRMRRDALSHFEAEGWRIAVTGRFVCSYPCAQRQAHPTTPYTLDAHTAERMRGVTASPKESNGITDAALPRAHSHGVDAVQTRTTTPKCVRCGAEQDIHQTRRVGGEWTPTVEGVLANLGWIGSSFCSRICRDIARRKTDDEQQQQQPVTRIADVEYQRTIGAPKTPPSSMLAALPEPPAKPSQKRSR